MEEDGIGLGQMSEEFQTPGMEGTTWKRVWGSRGADTEKSGLFVSWKSFEDGGKAIA